MRKDQKVPEEKDRKKSLTLQIIRKLHTFSNLRMIKFHLGKSKDARDKVLFLNHVSNENDIEACQKISR